jgi:hypothetical protein
MPAGQAVTQGGKKMFDEHRPTWAHEEIEENNSQYISDQNNRHGKRGQIFHPQ